VNKLSYDIIFLSKVGYIIGYKESYSTWYCYRYEIHHIRNFFDSKDLYITKRKEQLIRTKHPIESSYIINNKFQNVLDNTIATCQYGKDNNIKNFISFIDEQYILYGISNNGYYIHVTTLFYPSKKKLKQCRGNIKFFKSNFEIKFEKYIQ